MNYKSIALNSIGIIFLLFAIASIINTIWFIESGIAPILWFSYIGLFLLAIGILGRNASLIASQLCIILIPYIFWNVDFFYYLFNSKSLFGIVDYFFISGPIIGKIVSSQHIFNIPLSLTALYLIGLKRKDFWIISAFEITFLFFITRMATTFEQNVNCVYRNCARFDLGIWYPIQWFGAYILMILLTSWVLVKLFKKR